MRPLQFMLFAMMLAPASVSAQVSIDQALARAESIADLDSAETAPAMALQAEARSSARWQNPRIGAEWMSVLDRESELELRVSQEIPLSGAYSLNRKALEHRASAAKYDGETRRQTHKTAVAEAFYEALYRSERLKVLENRGEAVRKTLENLKKREAEGDASVFAVERVSLEAMRLDNALEREKAEAAATLGTLGMLLQAEAPTSVTGSLRVQSCGGEAKPAPGVRALEESANAERVLAERAGRSWIPSVEVEGGWVLAGDAGEDFQNGYLLGLSFALPIWQSASLDQDIFDARATALDAEKRLLETRVSHRAALLEARCQALLDNVASVEKTLPAAQRLLQRADAGYGAGELNLLELLDAQEAVLRDRLELVEVEYQVRRAQIAWITNNGGW